MTVQRDPSDETLLRFAAGSLPAGLSLVVAAHLETCARCRERVRQFEGIGGALLAEEELRTMRPDAFQRALQARAAKSAEKPPRIAEPRRVDVGVALPQCLRDCGVGPWRWLGPGLRRSWIFVPGEPQAKLMLLRGRPGLELPAHGHDGVEFTLVLKGHLSDERGAFGPGDFDEADAEVEHMPTVGAGGECICLAALDGGMRMQNRVARWLQPLLGF